MNPSMHHGRAGGPHSDAPMPQLQLLSNGRYHVMLTRGFCRVDGQAACSSMLSALTEKA